ncbi:uncharacterized protein LOC34621610 [Cyclospora cayetanensis]|uniref:Uncharacterized protein LOC34621610 n=1 Tax=Cyclospora cayetanensis TaxID=88456 RepID=A0A6P6S2A2_9EIME|nr:uncharacterized protein LOC34621610 [Cyclospora cayetanensis]
MDYFTGPNAKAAVFAVGSARFTLPAEVMGRADVQSSGLVHVVRKEGFKDIPPMVARTEDGALQISRPQQGFELMVEHLLGVEPLRGCPMSEFAEKYIALKTELLYWQLPTIDVAFDDPLFYQSAWTDGDCFFPLSQKDAAAFRRSEEEEMRPANLLQLETAPMPAELEGLAEGPTTNWQCWATPEPPQIEEGQRPVQRNRLYIVAGKDRFFCVVPGLRHPCVHCATLPDRNGFTPLALMAGPTEMTLIWSRGAFVHLHGFQKKAGEMRYQIDLIEREPSWLCVHPTLGAVLSGVEGPVPHVFCFSMPKAHRVRFFPWGALAISGEVLCEPPSTAGEGTETHARGLLDALGMSTLLPGQSEPKAVLAGTLLRFINKAFQQPLRIFFLNVEKDGQPVTLRRLADFDIHDLRNEDSSGFSVMVALRGALAETRADSAVADKIRGGRALVFPINSKGDFVKESQVLIDNGGPRREELISIALYGEYDCEAGKYNVFEAGKRLYEFHKQMFMTRSMGGNSGCNVM